MSFNPRTPCGVRLPGNNHQGQTARFQSTHSLRSATSYQLMRNGGGNVSIHALLAECDPICRLFAQPTVKFQSTHSLRSATVQGCYMPYRFRVSIHALLAECDIRTMHGQTLATGFNPRTPCGVRRYFVKAINSSAGFQSTHSLRSATGFLGIRGCRGLFQSTHSLRSATIRVKYEDCPHIVSIHALLAECDLTPAECETYEGGFNPRTPCGVRPDALVMAWHARRFQSTHSLRSATS